MYAAALDEYPARRAPDGVTAAMNRDGIGGSGDAFLTAAGARALANTEW